MEKLYYNVSLPGSLGGVEGLRKASKGKRSDVAKWLSTQDSYTLHKPRKLKFKRNITYASTLDEVWQADLVDLKHLKKYNGGTQYLLTVIDIFSRYAWVQTLKSKQGTHVKTAFQKIFKGGRIPEKIMTDKGKEFTCSSVQEFFKDREIEFYVTQSDLKAAVVERFNKTLKTRMWRYFTKQKTYKYTHILQAMVKSYNASKHRTLGMKPQDVKLSNQREVWSRVYNKEQQPSKIKFAKGDYVRITKANNVFAKGYSGYWSKEIFVVDQVITRDPVVYKIKDLKDEPILGIFYNEELQKVTKETVSKKKRSVVHK